MTSSTSRYTSSAVGTVVAYTITIGIMLLEPLISWFIRNLVAESTPSSHKSVANLNEQSPVEEVLVAVPRKRHMSVGSLTFGSTTLLASSPRRCTSVSHGLAMTPLPLLPLRPRPSVAIPPPTESSIHPLAIPKPPPKEPEIYKPSLSRRGPERTTLIPLPNREEPISRRERRARKKRASAAIQ